MGFEKGHKKVGGRKAGTPNLTKKELKIALETFICGRFEEATKIWEEIENPKDRVKLYCDLLQYVLPKAIKEEEKVEKEITIEQRLIELSQRKV